MASSAREPTTRSRTGLFLAYRSSVTRSTRHSFDRKGKGRAFDDRADDDERMELLERNGEARIDVDASLPPAWADLSDQVDSIVERVKPKSVFAPLSSLLKLESSTSRQFGPSSCQTCLASLYRQDSRRARD